jgi:hypothetical protein
MQRRTDLFAEGLLCRSVTVAARKCAGELLPEFFSVVIAFLGDFGFQKAAMTAAFRLDFFGLENEPDGWRFVRYAQHFVKVAKGDGGIEIGLAGGDAFGFQLLKGFGRVFQNSIEALLVHAEIDEGLGVLAKDGRGSEGGMDFRMAWIDLTLGAIVAERQHAVFEGAHSVETPLGVDNRLGELAFREGFRSEIDEEFVGERLVSGEIFGGQDYDAGRQAVAKCVQAGDLLPGLGTRPCTLLGVAAIGFYLDDIQR